MTPELIKLSKKLRHSAFRCDVSWNMSYENKKNLLIYVWDILHFVSREDAWVRNNFLKKWEQCLELHLPSSMSKNADLFVFRSRFSSLQLNNFFCKSSVISKKCASSISFLLKTGLVIAIIMGRALNLIW